MASARAHARDDAASPLPHAVLLERQETERRELVMEVPALAFHGDAAFFDALGLPRIDLSAHGIADEPFQGAVFPAGGSWIELWPTCPQMPAGTMLQIVVDDVDAMAATARANGLNPEGPIDAHGERIYTVAAPSGLRISFQSKLG